MRLQPGHQIVLGREEYDTRLYPAVRNEEGKYWWLACPDDFDLYNRGGAKFWGSGRIAWVHTNQYANLLHRVFHL